MSWRASLLCCGALVLAGCTSAADVSRGNPIVDLRLWSVEQMPGGSVTTRDGALIIEDAGGCTVWFREELTAPVEISYDITPVSRGGPRDRVSDVNCFWMASDPKAPHALPSGRSGKFADYDSLLTYYVGMGGNNNTTTRFRRYDGTAARPLLPEHDLSAKQFLLEPNKTYRIRLVARDGVAEFWRDGEKLFSFRDPAPLTSGWSAFAPCEATSKFETSPSTRTLGGDSRRSREGLGGSERVMHFSREPPPGLVAERVSVSSFRAASAATSAKGYLLRYGAKRAERAKRSGIFQRRRPR